MTSEPSGLVLGIKGCNDDRVDANDLRGWVGRPVFIRTRSGYNKFGYLTTLNEGSGFVTLAFFTGKINLIAISEIMQISAYRPHEGGFSREQ